MKVGKKMSNFKAQSSNEILGLNSKEPRPQSGALKPKF